MGLLMLSALIGLPAFAVCRIRLGTLAVVGIGAVWYLVLVVVWFSPERYSRFTKFGAWAYSLGLDLFLAALISAASKGISQ